MISLCSDYVTFLFIQMATTTAQHSLLSVPPALAKLFSFFPLKTYPPLKPAKVPIVNPLLWIHPPHLSVPSKESVLSADVECLKWQAHIALRGLRNISVRCDVSQDGAINARLPNLQAPSKRTKDPAGELIAAQDIPTWIDEKVGALDDLEGYKDIRSSDKDPECRTTRRRRLLGPCKSLSSQTFTPITAYLRVLNHIPR